MRKTYVKAEGPLICDAAIVGEQPGKNEVRQHRPFVGASGSVLTECLRNAGINRTEVRLTNVIKDLDTELKNYIHIKPNGNVNITENGQEYLDELKNELSKLETKVFIAVGQVALWALTGRTGITKLRGSILNCELVPNKLVVPIIHPATILPPKFQYLNKHLIRFDLCKAKRIINHGYQPLKREIIINPSYSDCMTYLDKCFQKGVDNTSIYFDIEVYNNEVSCISFSYSPLSAISIPFISSHGDYFDPDQESYVWLNIAEILEDPSIRKGGQNIGFDSHFLLRRYGIKTKNLDDTMIAQQITLPDYPKGLDFITSIHTDHPYYKDEGKRWFKVGGAWERLWHYNATDSIICAEAFPRQWADLVSQENQKTYERQRLLVEPLVFMQEHGIKVNMEKMKKLHYDYQEKVNNLQEQLNQLAGRPLNPNSPKQLKEYFYIEKGFGPYKKGGSITTNDTAIKRMIRKGSKEAELVKEIRSYRKLISNYLDVSKIDDDGRIRCSYNPVGTRYSRISSSQSIFGGGSNLQNWPHSMLVLLEPDEGWVFYSFDLSQAENRIVAYIGRIDQMIEAFETGKDVHSLTGALISGKSSEEVKEENKNQVCCSLGNGDKTWRSWGKKANHGLNYDLGYKSFAWEYEISEHNAKFLIERYHKAYPGVRNGFHSFVKDQLRKNRTLTNLMGRRTIFLDKWEDSLFKEAYSCIPQGTTGDVINERGLIHIYYNQNQFEPICLLNQVHDSIDFQIPLSTPWIDHARMLKDIKNSLEIPLTTYYGDKFVIPAELTVGASFSKENHGEELSSNDLDVSVEELSIKLESVYNSCYNKKYGESNES